MERREFIKTGIAAGAAAALPAGCVPAAKKDAGTGGMSYRSCGTDKVSLLGYGCMRWPFKKGPDGTEIPDQDKIDELVDYAIAHGVNYFDTAPVYCRGLSEEITGKALARHPRDKWLIATKMSTFGHDFGEKQYEESLKMYHNSLRLLQTDHIDYYLIHAVGGGGLERLHKRFLDIGLLDYFLAEREAGRIRHLGFSFHGDVKVFDYLLSIHDRVHWDFVQIQMNYADWTHPGRRNVEAEYLYGELEKRGIPAVIMEPLLGGRLASLPDHLAARLKARRPESSIASWSFRFNGTFPGVLTELSGMKVMEHLEENIRTFSPLEPCSEKEIEMLLDVATSLMEYPLIPCNACDYCMPCPYGIDIPGILRHYDKMVEEGLMVSSPDDSSFRKARRAYLSSYGRTVERFRQADHCIGCGQCNPHCPQGIDIPKELRKIDKYVEGLKTNTV